ncbi:MAG: 2-amino-4-hydroxy-6-hydroxymethyldihydropteridine diphosphokinase, partial [Pseudomonadota bacterium]
GVSPENVIKRAIKALGNLGEISAVSRFYSSPSWPDRNDPEFVNAVAALETDLEPINLLQALHGIEAAFGRVRSRKNGPRTLDLDLLTFGDRVLNAARGVGAQSSLETGLILPHPRMLERDFVLAPIADIAPDWPLPAANGKTAKQLLEGFTKIEAEPLPAG